MNLLWATESFSPGKWSLSIGAQQEALFGSTVNLNLSFLGFEINPDWGLEIGGGAGFFRTDNRSEIQRVRWYDNDLYFNVDFGIHYFLTGFDKKKNSSFRPFLGGGTTGTYIGSKYQLGGLLQVGALSYVDWTKASWAMRYGVIDRIYVPDLTGATSFTQNFLIYAGVQFNL